MPPRKSKRVVDRRWKSARSSYGTPSSSQIASDGIGSAKLCTRSTWPRSAAIWAISSSWPATIASIRGREAAQPVPGELRGEHLAQAGVGGRVGEAEAAGVLLGGDARFPDEVGEVAGERARRAEHGLRLVVAAHEPTADAERQLEQAHGLAVAQRCHLGHRVEPDALQRQQRLVRQEREEGVGRAAAPAPEARRQPRGQLDYPPTACTDCIGVGISAVVRHANETQVSLALQIAFCEHKTGC